MINWTGMYLGAFIVMFAMYELKLAMSEIQVLAAIVTAMSGFVLFAAYFNQFRY